MLLFVVGLVFVVAGGYSIHQHRHLNRTGERVPGAVVDLRWKASSSGDGNPAKAEINTRAGRAAWLPIIFTVVGVALICYGLFRATVGKT